MTVIVEQSNQKPRKLVCKDCGSDDLQLKNPPTNRPNIGANLDSVDVIFNNCKKSSKYAFTNIAKVYEE